MSFGLSLERLLCVVEMNIQVSQQTQWAGIGRDGWKLMLHEKVGGWGETERGKEEIQMKLAKNISWSNEYFLIFQII